MRNTRIEPPSSYSQLIVFPSFVRYNPSFNPYTGSTQSPFACLHFTQRMIGRNKNRENELAFS